KFPGSNDRLTTQRKSVGEVMAIGRTFQESLQKALRSLEIRVDKLDPMLTLRRKEDDQQRLREQLLVRGPHRMWYVADAFRDGMPFEEVYARSRIDRWFLAQIHDLVREEQKLQAEGLAGFDRDRMRTLKRKGF